MATVVRGCLVCGRAPVSVDGLQPIVLIGLMVDQGLCSMDCVGVFAAAATWGGH